MDAFCTYCCKGKTCDPGKIPAIERYTSQRIRSVYASALSVGQRFFILSGEYGLLSPSEPIRCYDHLLQDHEVGNLSEKVGEQLRGAGVQKLFYFTKPVQANEDEKLRPYFKTAQIACRTACVELVVVTLPEDG